MSLTKQNGSDAFVLFTNVAVCNNRFNCLQHNIDYKLNFKYAYWPTDRSLRKLIELKKKNYEILTGIISDSLG